MFVASFRKNFKPYSSFKRLKRFYATVEMEKFKLPKFLQGSTSSVWNEYTILAMEYKPINLAHGFPDQAPPSYITNSLVEAAKSENALMQQYTRGFGHMRLVTVISKLFGNLINRAIDPLTEVLITCGAYEALYAAILGHVDNGDEVIIIEPFFDGYEAIVKMAGGIPRFIPLRPRRPDFNSSADFKLDDQELESLFNEKTKMIILNTPQNPLGKVFKRDELEKIAALCRKWNVLCVSDEVYEWMVYENNEHIRICTLPDMWERTITIGSAGKTFCVTGWKVGWAYGPENLMTNLRMIHQNCVYTCPTPLQEAVAINFERELQRLNSKDSFFNNLAYDLQLKRDFMAKFLTEAGLRPVLPEGSFFMMADWSPLANKFDMNSEKDKNLDFRFTKWMTKNMGLLGIPPSVFYGDQDRHLGENYVRYCFIKKQETLKQAAAVFNNWKHL